MAGSDRARRVRTAKRTLAGVAVAALAIAIPVAMNFAASDTDPNFAEPGGGVPRSEPSAIRTTTDPRQDRNYSDTRLNIAVQLTAEMARGEFEGHVDFHPAVLPGPVEGGDTAFVEVFIGDEQIAFGSEGNRAVPDTIGGVPARRLDSTTDGGGPKSVWLVPNWVRHSSQAGAACCADPSPSLVIVLQASTPALGIEYEATLRTIVSSISTAEGVISSLPIQTRRGFINESVDLATTPALTVATFMDDRFSMDDPERLLTEEAKRQYAAKELPTSDPWLTAGTYGYFTSYTITSVEAVDANSFEATVVFGYQDQRERVTTINETIFIGPGEKPIRGFVGTLGETRGGPPASEGKPTP